MIWGNDERHPNAVDHRGTADRARQQQQQQQAPLGHGNATEPSVVAAVAVFPASHASAPPLYHANGVKVV